MITRIDHLGIAVRSIEATLPYYEKALGLKCAHREEVASQQVRTAFFDVGVTMVNAKPGWKLHPQWRLNLAVNNLLDRQQYTFARLPGRNATVEAVASF